jgi:ClpP class serine protease
MWLVAEDVARNMQAQLDAGLTATEAVVASFSEDVVAARDDGRPKNLTVAGDVAEISVEGLLTEKPDFWAWLFGFENTTYQSIQAAIAVAESDPSVKRVQFNVNSPGGTVAGFFDTIAAIQGMAKPRSVVTSYAASAAYGLAAVAGKITAKNSAVEVGSIGVAVSMHIDENVVDITSTNAPNKRPDVTTDAGKAVVVEQLDQLEELFIDAIANGRGTTAKDVRESFGRGSVMTAINAKKAGMIDAIAKPAIRAVKRPSANDSTAANPVAEETPAAPAAGEPQHTAAGGGTSPEHTPMNAADLKTQHPATHEAVRNEGVKAGNAEGTSAERKRVLAHLKMGEASGDMKAAHKAIEDGVEFNDPVVQAAYMAASMNRSDVAAAQADDKDAGAAVEGADTNSSDNDMGDIVAAGMEAPEGAASFLVD